MGMPYMPPHHAGAFMQQLGGRWMGGLPPGMGQYQRRDIASKNNGLSFDVLSKLSKLHTHTASVAE